MSNIPLDGIILLFVLAFAGFFSIIALLKTAFWPYDVTEEIRKAQEKWDNKNKH